MTFAANQYATRDPRTQYPQPPIADQPPSAPGLAGDMVPKPDHGETSHRGVGRLQGRRAFITAADSGIGRAAAFASVREGALTVASPESCFVTGKIHGVTGGIHLP